MITKAGFVSDDTVNNKVRALRHLEATDLDCHAHDLILQAYEQLYSRGLWLLLLTL